MNFKGLKKVRVKTLFNIVKKFVKEHWLGIIFVSIILIAIFFRFYKLDSIPLGVAPGEADIGNLAYKIENQGYSFSDKLTTALFPSLGVLFLKIFGNGILSLRLLSFTIGVLTVGLLYVFIKEWFNIKVALLSSFLLSISSWHVTLSRNVAPEVMIPFILLLAFCLVTLALRTQKKVYYIISAFVLGLGFYTSSFFIVFPLILAFFSPFLLGFFRRKLNVGIIKEFGVSIVLILVIATPVFIYIYKNLSSFTIPSGIKILKNGFNTLLLFNLRGDLDFTHNLGIEPLLDPLVGIAFVLGIVYIAFKIGRFKSHLKNLFLILWLCFGLLPAVWGEVVNSSKVVGMLPVVYILAAISIIFVLERWLKTFPLNKTVRSGILGVFILALLATTFYNWKRYFVAYARSPYTYETFNEEVIAIDQYLKKLPKETTKIVFIDNKKLPILNFLSYNSYVFDFKKPGDIEKLEVTDDLSAQVETVFVFDNISKKSLEEIRRKFPQGIYDSYQSELLTEQTIFYSYVVKK